MLHKHRRWRRGERFMSFFLVIKIILLSGDNYDRIVYEFARAADKDFFNLIQLSDPLANIWNTESGACKPI